VAQVSTPTLRWGQPAARWVLVATVGGSTLALVDATSVNVALPTIAADLGASVAVVCGIDIVHLDAEQPVGADIRRGGQDAAG
jgi:hypothetical protein